MLSRSRHDELSRRNEGRQLLSPHLNPLPEGEEEQQVVLTSRLS